MQSIKPDTKKITAQPVLNQIATYSLIELTEILIKHQNLHEGLYNLSLSFKIAVGGVGPSPGAIHPGAMIGVTHIGLAKIEKPDNQTVDASKVNPLPKQTAKTNK